MRILVLWTWRVTLWSCIVPELRLPDCAAERAAALRVALDANKWRLVWTRLEALLLFAPIVALLYVTPAFIVVDSLWFFLVGLCWIAVVGAWLGRKGVTRSAREYLNAHDVPVCLMCGYNLKGNLSGICPECGHPEQKKRAEKEKKKEA
jgi:hypothetical protein